MEHFLNLSIPLQLLSIYLIVVNLITFFIYGLDKAKSGTGARRTPEKTLWLLALLGGSPAALAAMKLFRHKTKKVSFQFILILILAVQAGLLYLIYTNLYV